MFAQSSPASWGCCVWAPEQRQQSLAGAAVLNRRGRVGKKWRQRREHFRAEPNPPGYWSTLGWPKSYLRFPRARSVASVRIRSFWPPPGALLSMGRSEAKALGDASPTSSEILQAQRSSRANVSYAASGFLLTKPPGKAAYKKT